MLIGTVAVVAYLFGSFLGRPAIGLTGGGQAVVCALLLFALRWSGYRLAIVPRGEPAG
jgi:hypothetical protein